MLNLNGLFSMVNWHTTVTDAIGYQLPNWLFFVINLILFLIILKMLYWLFKHVLRFFTSKTETQLDDAIVDAIEYPLLLFLFALFVITQSAFISSNATFLEWAVKIGVVIIIASVTWFVYNLIGVIHDFVLIPLSQNTESSLDDHLYPIVRKTLRILLVIVALFYTLRWLGIDITPLVAGVGVGGIALAFAAQKILGDLFGGISIFTSKPFKIGDTIKTVDGQGIVEEIGLRATTIRSIDGTLLVIPNSKISADTIENVTNRNTRKEVAILGLTYDTSVAKMNKAKEIVEEIIKKTKSLGKEYHIFFDQFNNSSLDLRVVYWIEEVDYGKYVKIKDSINMKIKEKFEKAGIEFAYPTHTVYMKK